MIQSAEQIKKNHGNVTVEFLMIEFAKLHVQKALEKAAENAKTTEFSPFTAQTVVKSSILNAYPLDLIK